MCLKNRGPIWVSSATALLSSANSVNEQTTFCHLGGTRNFCQHSDGALTAPTERELRKCQMPDVFRLLLQLLVSPQTRISIIKNRISEKC